MTLPRHEDIDKLVAFLRIFSAEGFQPMISGGAPELIGGVLSFVPTVYDPIVEEFIGIASEPPRLDYEYLDHKGSSVHDPEAVRNASLSTACAMLTFLVRGERFTDGSVGAAIEDGTLQGLLARIGELRWLMGDK